MKVNEIFYSLQGEGRYAGTPAVFVRLSGCNLRCWFCDTDYASFTEMSEESVVAAALAYPARHVVITGGEPTLQLTSKLTRLFHDAGFYIQLETNGTLPLPDGASVDWVTCSPKGAALHIQRIDEVKVVYESSEQDFSAFENIPASEFRIQPCDTGDASRNALVMREALQFVLDHPKWKLSLQTHKLLDIK